MFDTLLTIPIFNIMVSLYNLIPGHDIALTIILLTIIVKGLLWPIAKKAHLSNMKMQSIQPKIEALQKEYKDQKDKLGPEIMALYKREGVNYFSSCLINVVQIPFLIALYYVFNHGFDTNYLNNLYPFVVRPDFIHSITYFGMDLGQPSTVLAVIAGLAQFAQAKTMMIKRGKKAGGNPENEMAQAMSRNMVYIMPVITVVIGSSFPAALALYWVVSTAFAAAQQYYLNKKYNFNTSSPIIDVIPEKISS